MKMCMPLLSPAGGTLSFHMAEGQPLKAGVLIATLDLDDLTAVVTAVPFEGQFPPLGPPTAVSGKVHQRYGSSLHDAQMVLAGYIHNVEEVRVALGPF